MICNINTLKRRALKPCSIWKWEYWGTSQQIMEAPFTKPLEESDGILMGLEESAENKKYLLAFVVF